MNFILFFYFFKLIDARHELWSVAKGQTTSREIPVTFLVRARHKDGAHFSTWSQTLQDLAEL